MNILIVDDLVSVVNGIIKGVDWSALGILGIYKAHNAYEAKVLMNNLEIDILLTDIEMPGESGLDLAEWVKSESKDTACIFMSSHADFDYARRAIRSGGYSYVLLPCPYDEILETIRGAMAELEQKRQQRKLSAYGKMVSDDVWIAQMLFRECLEEGKNKGAVEKLVELGRMPRETQGYLCKLFVDVSKINTAQWDVRLMGFTLNNVISELMAPLQQEILMYPLNLQEYCFFFYSKDNGYGVDKGIFTRQMQMVQETMQGILRLNSRAEYEYCKDLMDIAPKYAALGRGNFSEEQKNLLKKPSVENQWLQYYNTEWIGHLQTDVADYIDRHKNDVPPGNVEVRIRLHTDLIQLMYKYLNQYNDSIFYIFETKEDFERYSNAYRSTSDLIWFVSRLSDYINKRVMEPKSFENPVEAVAQYVQEHIGQDIRRSDLAEHVHLNIDYLSRIFKREKGMTLNDYIVEEKMNVAKNLIQTTRLPVSLIAMKVGYSNFSYFSKIYKKLHGCSPAGEREKE